MKRILYLVFFANMITFSGCSLFDNCEDIACTTPPPTYFFKLVDKSTGENLLENGTYTKNQVEVLKGDEVYYEWSYEGDRGLINLSSIGWISGEQHYNIVMDQLSIPFTLSVNPKSEDCCSFFEETKFNVDGYDFERDGQDIINVYIE